MKCHYEKLKRILVISAALLAMAACSSPTASTLPTATAARAQHPAATAQVTPVPLPTSATTAQSSAEAQRALAAQLADLGRDLAVLDGQLQSARAGRALDQAALKRTVAGLDDRAGWFDSFAYPESLQAPFHDLIVELRSADQQALEKLARQPVNPDDIAALYKPVHSRMTTAGNALALIQGVSPAGATVTPIAQPSVQATAAP